MTRLLVRLLGPMEVLLDGQPVTEFASVKAQALLAYLIMSPGQSHPRSLLADLFWPERPESRARASLRSTLSRLRSALADRSVRSPFIVASRDTISFGQESAYWLDARVFQQLVHQGDPASLAEATTLYRGEFLEGFFLDDSPGFEDWAGLERERLHRQALKALREMARSSQERGDLEAACHWVRWALKLEPWQEEDHRLLMRLLAESGERTAALEQYRTCRRLLAEELGVEPDPETESLRNSIRDGDLRLAARPEPRLLNVPAPLTPIVGREEELETIGDKLCDPSCRLLTLFGAGGMGKTRLATEAARIAAGAFWDGVAFVPLSGVQSVSDEVAAITAILGIVPSPGAELEEEIVDYLQGRQMLLVLDAHEHLLEGAPLVAELLASAPATKVLVTSRARLNIPGEQVMPVEGLASPSPPESGSTPYPPQTRDYAAVELFMQGAEPSRPGFRPDHDEQVAISWICRRLAGMPLAILLAASWIGVLSPQEIADELGGDSASSIDFLAADWQGVSERERSMRAVFDHSWGLLTTRDQSALASLSVLRGTFGTQAARAVTGATLADLRRWVDRSLLSRDQDGRFGLHDLMRE